MAGQLAKRRLCPSGLNAAIRRGRCRHRGVAPRKPRRLTTREQVAAFFEERRGVHRDVRFEDVVFHHAQDATFMTYRVTGTDVASGEPFERVGVERYRFRDGRIAEKDVYSRPVLQAAA